LGRCPQQGDLVAPEESADHRARVSLQLQRAWAACAACGSGEQSAGAFGFVEVEGPERGDREHVVVDERHAVAAGAIHGVDEVAGIAAVPRAPTPARGAIVVEAFPTLDS